MSRTEGPFRRIHIVQGEAKVDSSPDVVMTTLLGSCVAACIRDPCAGIGGMNHFLLPGDMNAPGNMQSESYGLYLMELLINGLLKRGARRHALEAKLFGGARTVRSHNDIGKHNTEFAERFLRDEGIAHVGGSTGGLQGRRIQYWPVSGRARQILLSGTVEIERPAAASATVVSNAGELELF